MLYRYPDYYVSALMPVSAEKLEWCFNSASICFRFGGKWRGVASTIQGDYWQSQEVFSAELTPLSNGTFISREAIWTIQMNLK